MIPSSAQRFVDREQTRTEQGNWPTKVLVSIWFKSETNLATMIQLLRVVQDELKKKPYELKGQVVKARQEMSPQKKPLAKAHALFYEGMSAARSDESKIYVSAKFTPGGEGLADQGWIIIGAICTEYSEALFLRPL